jgi:2-C-methyl-D-erythritol 2,4-cyclodiphosphate synthase
VTSPPHPGPPGILRVGLGFDAHRFAEARPLILGGVRVREERGLSGHSDADVLTHAIMDALLGAAGLPDIGELFPDTDPRLAGADSLRLLGQVVERLRGQEWEVVNVDAVVVCQEPRLSPLKAEIRRSLAGAMGVREDRVMVKGKTTEMLGFTGRGEGIAVQAVALIGRTAS